MNRPDRLTWDSTQVAVYWMNGDGRLQFREYWNGTGEEDFIASTSYEYDQYERLDKVAGDTDEDQFFEFRRTYDEKDNPEDTLFQHKQDRSEVYETDGLNRLSRFRRGTLNGGFSDPVYEQDWHDTAGNLTLDKLGNWDAVRIDPDGDDTAASMTTTTRGHNTANEYTSLNGSAAYAHRCLCQLLWRRVASSILSVASCS